MCHAACARTSFDAMLVCSYVLLVVRVRAECAWCAFSRVVHAIPVPQASNLHEVPLRKPHFPGANQALGSALRRCKRELGM